MWTFSAFKCSINLPYLTWPFKEWQPVAIALHPSPNKHWYSFKPDFHCQHFQTWFLVIPLDLHDRVLTTVSNLILVANHNVRVSPIILNEPSSSSQCSTMIGFAKRSEIHWIEIHPVFWYFRHIHINVRPLLPRVVLKRVLGSQTQGVNSVVTKSNQNRVHSAWSQGPRHDPNLAKVHWLPTHDNNELMFLFLLAKTWRIFWEKTCLLRTEMMMKQTQKG